MDVTTLTPCKQKTTPVGEVQKEASYTKQLLRECQYFKVGKYDVQDKVELLITNQSFHSIIVTEGSGKLMYRDK